MAAFHLALDARRVVAGPTGFRRALGQEAEALVSPRGGDAAWNPRFATPTFRFLNPPHVSGWVKTGFRVAIHY